MTLAASIIAAGIAMRSIRCPWSRDTALTAVANAPLNRGSRGRVLKRLVTEQSNELLQFELLLRRWAISAFTRVFGSDPSDQGTVTIHPVCWPRQVPRPAES